MLAYIYDFLSILFDKVKEREKIRNIILFGSFARGNPRKESDIDLFIDVEGRNKAEVEALVRESVNEFELKIERTWKLKGVTNPIVPIVDDLNKEQWKELKQEMQSYSLVLYGRYSESEKDTEPSILIKYDLSKLKQKDKMKVIRKLHGYTLQRGKKVYRKEGIINDLKAEKISNAILTNQENYRTIMSVLKKYKVHLKKVEMTSSSP